MTRSTAHPAGRSTARRTPVRLAALAAVAALPLAACSATDGGGSPDPSGSGGGTVTLVTHDSFALSDGLLDDFEQQTGLTVEVVQPGDGGELANQLVLTKDAPLGDLVYGIDNSFASRVLDAGVVEPYTSTAPAAADAARYAVGDDGALTAIDMGDVCVNIDHGWFTEHGLAEPVTLEDLTEPEYEDLLVVPSATTSSPGLAFVLATIGAFGADGWEDYWTALVANGVKVDPGWSETYYTDFTAGGGGGPRPLALSYASSPPETVPEGGDQPTTGALLDTCFRQVEYAGVLAGAKNPAGAQQLLDFLLSDEVQADIPGSMYMYPVSSSVELPDEWAQWAPLADEPFEVDPADIAAHRDEWLTAWSDIVVG